jgi:hypothetical protein
MQLSAITKFPSTQKEVVIEKAVVNKLITSVKSDMIKPKVLNDEKISKCETKQDSEEIDLSEFNKNLPKEQAYKCDFTLSLDLAANEVSNMSSFPRGSMNSILSIMNFSKSILNASRSNMRVDYATLGEKLKTILLSHPIQNLAIQLPKETIEVDELIIEKNVTFIGTPESKIKITKGPVHVKGAKVIFKECEIILARCNDPSVPKGAPRKLLEVHNDTELELIDCMLTLESVALQPDSELAEIAIYVHSQVEDRKPGTLNLTACSFMRFFNHIIVGKDCTMNAKKCGFAQSKNTSIVATDSSVLSIVDSSFTGTGAYAIEAHIQHSNPAIVVLMFRFRRGRFR